MSTQKIKQAYKNIPFLLSPKARPIRILSEFIEPEVRLEKNHIYNTIVFYGSARIKEEDVIKSEIKLLEEKRLSVDQNSANIEKIDVKIQELQNLIPLARFYKDAYNLGYNLTKWSLEISDYKKRFHVTTGGGPGIMEAANKGALDAGGKSIGMSINLPFESTMNEHCTQNVSFEFHYFFIRKYWLLFLSKALVAFPGGYGTFDEIFEVLTLIQTKKLSPMPIVLFGSEYWNNVVNFQKLADLGLISKADLSFFKIIDTIEEAQNFLLKHLSSKKKRAFL